VLGRHALVVETRSTTTDSFGARSWTVPLDVGDAILRQRRARRRGIFDAFTLRGHIDRLYDDPSRAFSKAYIYKFFTSKQVIGEMICANCLREIEAEVRAAVDEADRPPEKLRRMFKAIVEASLRLFFQDRKLYEIAASAATERWQATRAYEECIQKLLHDILQEGRQTGDFERKTPLDETAMAIYLVMRPYLNPLLLQHGLDYTDEAPALLSSLVLRSLSP
jgi:AcrR family transcriptional regulator